MLTPFPQSGLRSDICSSAAKPGQHHNLPDDDIFHNRQVATLANTSHLAWGLCLARRGGSNGSNGATVWMKMR